MQQITWEPFKVAVRDLKENPNNPKVLNTKGQKRLQKTLAKYGLAGTIVVNKDLSIIDGHSRKIEMELQGISQVWVSVPDRQLTEAEYKEFNAVFDLAKAGEPDIVVMEADFGDEFMQEWELDVKGYADDKATGEGSGSGESKRNKKAKEKAIYLVGRFAGLGEGSTVFHKQCAAILVDETIDEIECMITLGELLSTERYLSFWKEVKNEIGEL